jgi:hypothetical protein
MFGGTLMRAADPAPASKKVTRHGRALRGYLYYLLLCVACRWRQQIGLFLILSRDVKRQSFSCSCEQAFKLATRRVAAVQLKNFFGSELSPMYINVFLAFISFLRLRSYFDFVRFKRDDVLLLHLCKGKFFSLCKDITFFLLVCRLDIG